MKKLIIVCFVLVLILTLISCASTKVDMSADDTETPVQPDSEAASEDNNGYANDTEANSDTAIITDIPSVDTNESNSSANGGTGICTVHDWIYHAFPASLSEYVGYDNYRKWYDEQKNQNADYNNEGCTSSVNIYDFIHKFELPKDVFVNFYNESGYYYQRDYDIDLLFDGSAEENDEYYRNYTEREENIMNPRKMFSSLKTYIRTTRQKELKEILGEKYGSDMSIAEMIYLLDISRDELVSIIEEGKSKVPYAKSYDYDLDLIYGQREEVEALIKEHSAFYMDQLFCGEEPREQAYPE